MTASRRSSGDDDRALVAGLDRAVFDLWIHRDCHVSGQGPCGGGSRSAPKQALRARGALSASAERAELYIDRNAFVVAVFDLGFC